MTNSPIFSHTNLADGKAPWMELPSLNKTSKTIHISAANGFTVGSYLSFVRQFSGDYKITGMDCRGTWPGHETPPDKFNMHHFADDLIQAIEIKHSTPIIGMGHSQGGFVSLLAAIKRPDLFSHLILIEPASLPNPWVDIIYPYIPEYVLFKLMPFIEGSLNRQRVWQNVDAFHQRYRQHNTYKKFTDQAFNDYVKYGLVQKKDQWQLRFSPQWESYIFRIVEFIWKYLPKVTIPTLFIRAEHSNLYSHSQFIKSNQSLPNWITCEELNNTGHMLPQEAPVETSNLIKDWLKNQNLCNNF